MRHFMSVNLITKTHMEKLDNMSRQYLKLWLRIPKHGVTDASIFHPYMLNIKTPLQLYKLAQASTYAIIRKKVKILLIMPLIQELKENQFGLKSIQQFAKQIKHAKKILQIILYYFQQQKQIQQTSC